MQAITTKVLSLSSTIKGWLEQKPPEEVVCFDNFSGQHHGLIDAWYAPTLVSTEYGKVKERGRGGRTLASYDQDLTRFNHWLLMSHLRYCPTAQALLQAIDDRAEWDHPTFPFIPPTRTTSLEHFNACHESAFRPEDVSWRKKEMVMFEGKDYEVESCLDAQNKFDGGHDTYIHAEEGAFQSAEYYLTPQVIPIEWVEKTHLTRYPSHAADYAGNTYRFGAFGRMEELTTKTILCNGTVFGVWQRQGHRLLRIQ
jgi:hypothetical protein